MIYAEEARKLSEQGLNKMIIENYEGRIREAAQKGKFEIRVNSFFDSTVRDAFESCGYKVDECDEGGYTTISW